MTSADVLSMRKKSQTLCQEINPSNQIHSHLLYSLSYHGSWATFITDFNVYFTSNCIKCDINVCTQTKTYTRICVHTQTCTRSHIYFYNLLCITKKVINTYFWRMTLASIKFLRDYSNYFNFFKAKTHKLKYRDYYFSFKYHVVFQKSYVLFSEVWTKL
jgi:hypothetical protein